MYFFLKQVVKIFKIKKVGLYLYIKQKIILK